jgi:hypothetical protein
MTRDLPVLTTENEAIALLPLGQIIALMDYNYETIGRLAYQMLAAPDEFNPESRKKYLNLIDHQKDMLALYSQMLANQEKTR